MAITQRRAVIHAANEPITSVPVKAMSRVRWFVEDTTETETAKPVSVSNTAADNRFRGRFDHRALSLPNLADDENWIKPVETLQHSVNISLFQLPLVHSINNSSMV